MGVVNRTASGFLGLALLVVAAAGARACAAAPRPASSGLAVTPGISPLDRSTDVSPAILSDPGPGTSLAVVAPDESPLPGTSNSKSLWSQFGFASGPRPTDTVGGWFARGYSAEGKLMAFRRQPDFKYAYGLLTEAVMLSMDLDGTVLPPTTGDQPPLAITADVVLHGRSTLFGTSCAYPVDLKAHPEFQEVRTKLDDVDQATRLDPEHAARVEACLIRQLDRLRERLGIPPATSFRSR